MAKKRQSDLATSPLAHRTLDAARRVPHPHAHLPDARRLPDRDPAQAALHFVHEQPGAQRSHPRRAVPRHHLRLPSGEPTLSRDPLGERLPHRRPGPCHLAPADPARAHGGAACATAPAFCRCRPHRRDRSWTRSARGSTRHAIPAAISSACSCSSACSARSGASCRPSHRSAAPSMPSTPAPPTMSPCSRI